MRGSIEDMIFAFQNRINELDGLEENLSESRTSTPIKFNVTDQNSPFYGKVYDDEDEDEDEDIYTAVDLLNDRLFGYGLNKSNFRNKWKFAEVEPLIRTENGKIKRSYFYPTNHIDGVNSANYDRRAYINGDTIGVYVYNEDEALLAKTCAEELNLRFELKKTGKYSTKDFPFIAIIYLNDRAEELPLEEYVKSIGKSIDDFKHSKNDKTRTDFVNNKNYLQRSNKKELVAVGESLHLSSDDDFEILDRIVSEIYDKLLNLLRRYEKNNVDVHDIENCCERAIILLTDVYE